VSERRRLLVALVPVYLSVFLFVAGNSALSILIPIYLSRSAHLGAATIGAAVAVFGIASLVARLPVGLSYSRSRGPAFLVAGGALSAAAFALVPLVTDPLLFGGLMALNGLGWSIATTAQLAMLVARPPAGVSTAAAMGWFSGATGFGNVVGGVLGGVTADAVGLRATFFILAVTPLIGAFLMLRTVAASDALVDEGERAAQGAPWRAIFRLPLPVWVGVLVMFFINGLNSLTNTFHPLLALAAGMSVTQIGVLSSIRSWASSSSRFGSGPLFSRFDPAGLTLPLVIAGTLATCLIPSVIGSFALQVPLFVLAGVSRGLLRVTGSVDAFRSVGGDDRLNGLTSALLYGGLDLGKIVVPFVGGAAAGLWGIATMFRILPAILLVLYLALAVPARRALSPQPVGP
jgi:DHA1 family multidrug resistance protein-like MFS transporter